MKPMHKSVTCGMLWALTAAGPSSGSETRPAAARPAASQPAASQPAAAGEDWPMFRGNPQLTGAAGISLPNGLQVRWKYEAGEAVDSSAAIVDGIAYVGSDDMFLHAIDLKTGKVLWKYEAKGAIRSSPCVVDGVVYFGDEDGTFHAVRAGRPREKANREEASGDNAIGGGHAIWELKTGGEINSSANHAGGRLLFGSYDDYLYCVSAKDGRVIWKTETEGRIHGAPAIAGDKVLVAGCDQQFHVFRLADGTISGTVSMGSFSGCSPAVRGPLAYVGTFNNEVVAIDWTADRIVWTYLNPERESPFYASAAVTGDTVVIGGRDKLVHCLDAANGKTRWTFATQDKVDASPVICGPDVFVASTDGVLYRLDLATGREKWRFDSGSSFLASPAIGDGVLVIGTEDKVLYCFGPATRN